MGVYLQVLLCCLYNREPLYVFMQKFRFARHITGETPRNSVLLTDAVKNYISASLLACKQCLLMLSSNGKAKGRVARVGVAKAEWPEARWLEAQWPEAS